MAHLKFRVATIVLDEEEDVSSVTAVVDLDAHGLITDLLGSLDTTDVRRGGTEMTVTLPLADMLKLFHEIGRIPGDDPQYARGVHEIYVSLSAVVYGLMGE